MKKMIAMLLIVVMCFSFVACGGKDNATTNDNGNGGETETRPSDIVENNVALDWNSVSIGDYVTFGAYEQDSNTANGKEKIEWLVLDKKDGQIFITSKYGLDCQQFNTFDDEVTWETCTLREWLNNDFLINAFSDEEQSKIPEVIVPGSSDSYNATKDKIFLLSTDEVETYFDSDEARKCAPTDYAIEQGARTNDDYSVDGRYTCQWLMRSSGGNSHSAAKVDYDGNAGGFGYGVTNGGMVVRPALWLSLAESENTTGTTSTAEGVINDYIKVTGDPINIDASVTVGDHVVFGSYEQDGDTSNGEEAIEWLVLDKQDDKILVISKYGLDCQPYNTSHEDGIWENSPLRIWLNNEFMSNAFSPEEQAMIPTVTVPADKNSWNYNIDPGNATQDKVFILSIVEAEKYLPGDENRMCYSTNYAISQGAHKNDSYSTCVWWLRTPGDYYYSATYVSGSGDINQKGCDVVYINRAVRPAMWISIGA